VVNTTLNKFGKKLPPVKKGQRFGEEIKKDKKVGLFSERRFLIFTKRGPIEIAFKPIHYASVIMTTIIGLTSIVYWSAKGIHSAIDVAKKNDIITIASANISNPIENDSDTVVNINTNDQSNISLPILKNNFLIEENDTNSYKPLVDKNINNKEEFVGLNYKEVNNKTTANNLKIDLFNETMRNQDLPINFTNQLVNESNIFISENTASNQLNDDSVPSPPKINDKVKTIRFIASVDNEISQMENVFDLINVKLNDNDLVSLKSITKKTKVIDPDSDEFFRSLKKRINLLSIYKDALQNIPLKPPMEHYYVSSPYGPRKHPVTGKYRMHHGIDLAGTWQENVSVSADGTVVFAGYHGSFGKVIRIKHNYGIMTTYGHLAKINVRRGDLVSEGQIIGKMGRTGKVKGAHLHYEISVNGKSQNPATYIKIGRNLLSRTSLKTFANKNLN
jgi:murein DD-endopeptidase MepM/ murein hydrolase activator NlpD